MFPREVLRIHDRLTRPPKPKRVICVCDEWRLFLRLNSQPLWPPQHAIFAVNNPFLDHDSFVELSNLIQYAEEDCNEADSLGRLSQREAQGIYEALEEWGTLPPAHLQLVRERWVL
jgi:hypothetical protein